MSDLARMRTARRIARLDHDPTGLTLTWDDGRQNRFAVRWLRDNCACPQCRHPQALERTYVFLDHPAPTVASALLRADGSLEVGFITGSEVHVSLYARGWLRRHGCSQDDLLARRLVPQLWDSGISARLPTLDYDTYMHTNEGLREWIEALRTHAIVLLRHVPDQPGKLVEAARRIGPVRGTNFGEYYDVVSMPNPNASANTSMGLELHTDLANWQSPPDIQLLCCLDSSVTGGESMFADGFKVAEDLRLTDPEAYGLLSKVPVDFRFHDDSCDIRASGPTLGLDHEGRLRQVRFNNWLRAPLIVAEHLVEPVYDALEKFWRCLRNPRNHLNLRLQPGDLIAYDNWRVLHGRASFEANSGARHLQGCYINREDLESKLLLLDRVPA